MNMELLLDIFSIMSLREICGDDKILFKQVWYEMKRCKKILKSLLKGKQINNEKVTNIIIEYKIISRREVEER